MAPIRLSHSVRVGVSKAQASLAKIIAIISTLPPPRIERGGCNSEAARAGGRGLSLGLDLNLRLGLPPEIGGGPSENEDDEGGGPTAQSGGVVESGEESTVDKGSGGAPHAAEQSSAISPAERSSEGECDSEEGGEESRKEWRADDGDEDEESAAAAAVIKKEENQEEKETKGGDGSGREEAGWNRRKFDGNEGYLDVLLEAVRQVSGGLFEEEPGKEKAAEEESVSERRAAQGSKRRRTGWLPFHPGDDSAPIVRSKRGRSQALPSRFRDSVLDPWRKLPTVTRVGRAARP